MLPVKQRALTIFVDRSAQQWIVRDADGSHWIVPSGEDAWNRRKPFLLSQDTDLEPVPSHYKYLLQLPF